MSPRTPLVRPAQFFREHTPSLRRTVGVVVAVTVALLLAGVAIGLVMTAQIDGTVPADGVGERNVDGILWGAIGSVLVQFLVLPAVGWAFVGLLLHAGSWLAGGEGGVGRSFAVAAWGMAPAVVVVPVAVALFALTFDPVTVSAGADPAAVRSDLSGSLGAFESLSAVLGFVSSLWAGAIWAVGLVEWRGLTTGRAAVIAGVLVLLGLLGGA